MPIDGTAIYFLTQTAYLFAHPCRRNPLQRRRLRLGVQPFGQPRVCQLADPRQLSDTLPYSRTCRPLSVRLRSLGAPQLRVGLRLPLRRPPGPQLRLHQLRQGLGRRIQTPGDQGVSLLARDTAGAGQVMNVRQWRPLRTQKIA